MALEVIGAGFGRTGTLSLKAALERLGLGPCYHMFEVLQHPEHAQVWARAGRSEPVDWADVLEGYAAAVDWPVCAFWRELTHDFPEAKVVLSVRDPQRWYTSFRSTIYEVLRRPLPDMPYADDLREMRDRVVVDRSFGGDLRDEAHMVSCYERHNAAVRTEIPAERLLVYDVAQGWEPLCRFLDVPVPDEPFPNVNDREFFRSVFGVGDDG